MKKKYIIKKNEDFSNIIKNGNKNKSNLYYVYYLKNYLDYNRYGIAVSKKIGNAVIRNKNKRQVKSIVDNIKMKIKGYDFVVILKTNINDFSYIQKEEDIRGLFNNIGEKYEKNPLANPLSVDPEKRDDLRRFLLRHGVDSKNTDMSDCTKLRAFQDGGEFSPEPGARLDASVLEICVYPIIPEKEMKRIARLIRSWAGLPEIHPGGGRS
jgi:ribonuclease P protein component